MHENLFYICTKHNYALIIWGGVWGPPYSLTCQGGSLHTPKSLQRVQTGSNYHHHPRFFAYRLGCKQDSRAGRVGKKTAIDVRLKSLFLPPMTALLYRPPLHSPRVDNSWGFFGRVNGGGLILSSNYEWLLACSLDPLHLMPRDCLRHACLWLAESFPRLTLIGRGESPALWRNRL